MRCPMRQIIGWFVLLLIVAATAALWVAFACTLAYPQREPMPFNELPHYTGR